jgi:hypothetical protein
MPQGRSPDLQIFAFRLPSHSSSRTVAISRSLPAYSGGTVRDFHPLPFSLAFHSEHLGRRKISQKVAQKQWRSSTRKIVECPNPGGRLNELRNLRLLYCVHVQVPRRDDGVNDIGGKAMGCKVQRGRVRQPGHELF